MKHQKKLDGTILVYVGTYTNGNSKGIYCCRLDTSTGELRPTGFIQEVENPSYLAIDSKRHCLFAVSESSIFDGRPGGSVSAFIIQPSGELQFINEQYSHGGAPCYLRIDGNGRNLLLVNYVGGNIVVMPIGEEGALEDPSNIVTHMGSSQHPIRQKAPHPHSIVLDSTNNFAFVPDLGLDKVMQYRFDSVNGRMQPNERPFISTTPGSGPRHMVFHPNDEQAFVINELTSTITGYAYDVIRGQLREVQTISTVPEGYIGPNIAADLHLSPNGRFLYGSNRGYDSIAAYTVDPDTGWLTLIDFVSTQGAKPRGFAIDPTGTFLLVANQDSNSIVTFRVEQNRGTLIPTGYIVHIPSPVCLKFIS